MKIVKNSSFTNKVWAIHENDSVLVDKIMQVFSIDRVIAEILVKRDVGLEDMPSFFQPKLKDQMKDPNIMQDMVKAYTIIYQTIANNEKIIILGDYDVDGITSTTILYRYLKNLKANVCAYIPDRYKEGYGISKVALVNIMAMHPKLLILLDNGSLSFEEVEIAKNNNITVIIVDHHSVDTKLPKADAFINPQRIDDTSHNQHLCTVGLVFLLLVGLNRYFESKYFFNNTKVVKEDLMNYLDLVALGTVCDMVPLKGLNRAYINSGLKIMHKRQNMAIKYLADLNKISKPIDIETIGFTFGPCINAGSRMGDSNLPLNLFLEDNEVVVSQLTERLINLNKQRQVEEAKIINSAVHEINKIGDINNNCIFIGSTDWLAGVVGIIAGRIKETYMKPTLIFSIDKETNIATGSGRSIAGIDLGNIIIGAKQQGLLLKGGGHAQAVGFSFDLAKKEELFNFIKQKIEKINVDKGIEQVHMMVDAIVPINIINENFVDNVLSLQPFGINFSEPIFMLSNVRIDNIRYVGTNKNHIMCEIGDGIKFNIKSFCYKCIPSLLGESIVNSSSKRVDVLVNVKSNFYQGKCSVNLNIVDISECNI